MKLYKLTDRSRHTKNNTLWGENVTHTVSGEPKLCSPTVLHAYTDPRFAVIFNPIHADFNNPFLWEAEGEVVIEDNIKVGCQKLTTIKQIPLPEIDLIKVAINCVKQVYKEKFFIDWLETLEDTMDICYRLENFSTKQEEAAYYLARAVFFSHERRIPRYVDNNCARAINMAVELGADIYEAL